MSELSPQYDENARFAGFGGRRPTAFVDSRRHTARVQFLRRAIVICCVSAVALIGFVLVFDPMHRLELGFSVGRVGLEGTRITMERPRLSGYRADGQPYEIKAMKVVQDTAAPKLFQLDQVDAKLGAKDGSTTRIEALKGKYDSDTDQLDLFGVVRVRNEGRYDMSLKRASIDMKTNSVQSSEPVSVAIPGGVVEAGALAFSESAQCVAFSGSVHSSFEGGKDDGAAATPENSGAAQQ